MPQIYFGVDFIQAFNPLYAFPIVAVILCAFLVYAFGFKAPVQPPSFDEIEIDKKTTKRRKGKENVKAKQQNGKISSSSSKVPDNAVPEKKKRSEKITSEKSISKSDKSVKKASLVSEKQKSINHEHSALDDGNEEGWVHHVSKRGRKNKKKDEAISSMDTIPTPLLEEITMDVSDKDSENVVAEDVFLGGKTDMSSTSLIDDALDKVQKKDTKKSETSRKKSKKKEKVEVSLMPNITKEEQNSPELIPTNDEKESSFNESLTVSKEKKPKKKKKKHENEKVISPDADTAPSSFPTEISKNDLPPNFETKHDYKVVELENLMNTSSLKNAEINDGKNDNCTVDESIGAKGANVAFDELEGLYPDSKPQKKKKKVRREH